jgi:hypothetical protein
MTDYNFDDSNIKWGQLEGFDHLHYCVLNVDRDNMIVDALFKFAANQKIALHRHVALNHLLVIQGEHILYEPNGKVKETRPTGRYTVSPPVTNRIAKVAALSKTLLSYSVYAAPMA